MKTTFIRSGTRVFAQSFEEGQISEQLLPAVYSLNHNPMSGYYLEKQSDRYSIPDRIYGDFYSRVLRVQKFYEQSKRSIGVLSTGIKGAGKSMFSCMLCNSFIDKKIPIIQISEAYGGTAFNNFIDSLGDCVLFFDEFAKIYARDDEEENDPQNALLTILDGTSHSKRLHLFTENEERHINSFMLNRPGRIRYHFRHNRLDDAVVADFCEDHNVPAEVVKELISATSHIGAFSFDILNAIVTEWKLFGGRIGELVEVMNIPTINPNMVMRMISIDVFRGRGVACPDEIKQHKLIDYKTDGSLGFRVKLIKDASSDQNRDEIREDGNLDGYNYVYHHFYDDDLISVIGDTWTFQDDYYRGVFRRIDTDLLV